MASTGVVLDPLTSSDGTPIDIEKSKGLGRAFVTDDLVIELLISMRDSLNKILMILATEFEQEQEILDGIED